jgi:translation initiation factor IF-3
MQAVTKVIQLVPNMPENDLQPKRDHVTRFLRDGDSVRVNMRFKGRLILHPERGEAQLIEFAQSLKDHAKFELPPIWEDRILFLMLTPTGVKE